MARRSSPPVALRRLLAVFLAAAGLVRPHAALAEILGTRTQVASEARVQAGFMLKFPAYVEWPGQRHAKPGGAMVIAVVNGDDIAEELRRIGARLAPESRPVVKTVRPGDSLAGVDMLYVGGDDWPRYQGWVQQAARHACLVISAHPGALDYGSMLNFRRVSDRVRFEISLPAVEQANLRIGAPLLALAVAVQR